MSFGDKIERTHVLPRAVERLYQVLESIDKWSSDFHLIVQIEPRAY